MPSTTTPLEPSVLGQWLAHGQCLRYLRQQVDPGDEPDARDWREAFDVLNLALLGAGREFEADQVDALAADATYLVGPEQATSGRDVPDSTPDVTWADDYEACVSQLQMAVDHAAALPTSRDPHPYIILYQVPLAGTVGDARLGGAADVVIVSPRPAPDEDDELDAGDPPVDVTVIDCKRSREDSGAHRFQVALYASLLADTLGEVQVRAGVLTRAEAAPPGGTLSPAAIPRFDWAEWAVAADQKLRAGGPVDIALDTDLDELLFTSNDSCNNCSFREACHTRATERPDGPLSLALLGLDTSEQLALIEAGVDSLVAVSELVAFDAAADPTNDPTLAIAPERYRELDALLAEPLADVARQAQALRGELDPEATAVSYPPLLPSADFVPLPNDDREGWGGVDGAAPGTLVQVGLVVRRDPATGRLAALGGTVTSGDPADAMALAEVTEALPEKPELADRMEAALLERFLPQLFEAMASVSEAVDRPAASALVHLYTFSELEQRTLVEALERHDGLTHAGALRSLLALAPAGTSGIDQAMAAAVQPILDEHFALQHPTRSLPTLLSEFDPSWHLVALDPDGDPPLTSLFRYRFLDDQAPYETRTAGLRFLLGHDVATDADGWYPLRPRAGVQVPIEYLWATIPRTPGAATPRLHPGLVDEWAIDDPETAALYRQEIDRYRLGGPAGTHQITRDDIRRLFERLSSCLVRLVEAVPFRDRYLPKTPIDVTDPDALDLTDRSLGAAVRDHVAIEHGARREETLAQYARPITDRVRTGRSIPLRPQRIDPIDGGGCRVTAEFAYDALFGDPTEAAAVAHDRRASGGALSGDWRVLTRLEPNSEPTDPEPVQAPDIDAPWQLKHSPPVLIEAVDAEAGQLTFTLFGRRFTSMFSPYRVDHCGWRTDGATNLDADAADDPHGAPDYPTDRTPVELVPGELYVLDVMLDDFATPKVTRALKAPTLEANALATHLDRLRTHGTTTRCRRFDADAVTGYLDGLETAPDALAPNPGQRALVTNLTDAVVGHQGPPGTGKTAGAAAPAMVARAVARLAADQSFLGIAVAPSHTAVDATLSAVVDRFREGRPIAPSLADLDLVRAVPELPPSEHRVGTDESSVSYLDYTTATGQETLASHLEQVLVDADPEGCLVFATPETLYRVLGIAASIHPAIEGDSAPAAMRSDPGLADVVLVDEASMVDLGRFLLVGSAVRSDGQTLVVGDHRQLPAVTAVDWADTLRTMVTDVGAHRSAIGYLQWLADRPIDDPLAGPVLDLVEVSG